MLCIRTVYLLFRTKEEYEARQTKLGVKSWGPIGKGLRKAFKEV